MCSGPAPTLARWLGVLPIFNIAPLVPSAAQGAALNLLALERAWCDGRRWFN
jgi:hypothetical protein